MGGFFGVASKRDCVFDLFFGTDYHSHLGTRRGGMAVYGEQGFERSAILRLPPSGAFKISTHLSSRRFPTARPISSK